MKAATFKGGIHPYTGKELSKDFPIKEAMPTGDLIFPMSQHIGAPSKPVVAVGDKVLVGQKIAEAGGFVSADICSSVSGTVKAIEPRLTVSGAMVTSIVIANDNEYKAVPEMGKKRDLGRLTKEDIRKYVKEAGIVGMGGAGFPTHVKLTPKDDNAIDFVIVNGAECEPYLTSDYRMMLEEPEKIVGGLKCILKLFPKAKGIISIEDNKMDAVAKLSEAASNEPNIEVKVLKAKYPQGAERTMIYASTGRKINSSMLPADAGCVVNNIDTVIAIYKAVCESTPLIRRIVTVTGDAAKSPQNYKVKTGTTYASLLETAGGFKDGVEPEKIISGGPMMGMSLHDLNVPITKTASALLCLTRDEVAACEPTPCIRCGRCIDACPSRLIPQKMEEYAKRFDNAGFVAVNGMECYECGSCTYVCPARRRLTQSFKQARAAVAAERRAAAAKAK